VQDEFGGNAVALWDGRAGRQRRMSAGERARPLRGEWALTRERRSRLSLRGEQEVRGCFAGHEDTLLCVGGRGAGTAAPPVGRMRPASRDAIYTHGHVYSTPLRTCIRSARDEGEKDLQAAAADLSLPSQKPFGPPQHR